MEKYLFKGFKIFNGKEFINDDCLLVEDGKIAKIGTGLECADAEVIEGNGRLLTPGFIDLHAHFRDPGLEWNEDLKSGAMAGAAGGFTTLVAMPNTKPAISEPALVEYVLSHGADAKAARILPAGCVSKKREGKEICEVGNCIGDGDLDMRVPIEPFVEYEVHHRQWKRYEWKRIDVDRLMEIAGYVNGNKEQFKDPVILHKDNDWLNFNSENLEWTDRSDPRYREYHNRKVDEMNALGRKLNGDKWDYMERQDRFQHV